MRIPVNDNLERLPPRLNTSRNISNELAYSKYTPALLPCQDSLMTAPSPLVPSSPLEHSIGRSQEEAADHPEQTLKIRPQPTQRPAKPLVRTRSRTSTHQLPHRNTTTSVHPNPLRSIKSQTRGQITSTQLDNHVLRILPRHMRALINDDFEGFPPRLNTSRDISNESIVSQPNLLDLLSLRLEKRNRKNTGRLIHKTPEPVWKSILN